MEQLEGRVAVVTGGASGIGRGMIGAFADAGMKLVLVDVEKEPLEKAVAELVASGHEAVGLECDVSDVDAVERTAERAFDAFGAVHVLCNNAGVAGAMGGARGRGSWNAPLADWEWVINVNLWGVIYCVRAFLGRMVEQGEEGHVVNTASMAGLLNGSGVYGVTKHGVVAYSESLFNELRMLESKIGVSVLCPGFVSTRIMESDRNRPERPRETGELDAGARAAMAFVQERIKSGLDPRVVGGMVADAIRTRRFYILTDPAMAQAVRGRLENILEGRDPIQGPLRSSQD
jgi:NAD(P)-dependent dehydrogenase (short-subunit alcohol dehydrogenase family)